MCQLGVFRVRELVQIDAFFDSFAAQQAKNWLDQAGSSFTILGSVNSISMLSRVPLLDAKEKIDWLFRSEH
jgi:hypothetical protein